MNATERPCWSSGCLGKVRASPSDSQNLCCSLRMPNSTVAGMRSLFAGLSSLTFMQQGKLHASKQVHRCNTLPKKTNDCTLCCMYAWLPLKHHSVRLVQMKEETIALPVHLAHACACCCLQLSCYGSKARPQESRQAPAAARPSICHMLHEPCTLCFAKVPHSCLTSICHMQAPAKRGPAAA